MKKDLKLDEVVLSEGRAISITSTDESANAALEASSLFADSLHDEAHLIHPRGADPFVTSYEGGFLYLHTTQHSIGIWRSSSLRGIAAGKPQFKWRPPRNVTRATKNIWAPEIHRIGDKWYIYYAADNGNNSNHRMYVLESEGRDPLGPYRFRGQIKDPKEDRWAIDGTVLQIGAQLYFIWSGWPGKRNGLQNLYIAPMKDPCNLAESRRLLTTPEYSWELWVNEGPQVLERNGRTFIVYSAHGSWTDDYKLGILELVGTDVLDKRSWIKHPEPVFASVLHHDPRHGIYAPGHASFLHIERSNEDWIFYHVAKHKGAAWKREVRAQRFAWKDCGLPQFRAPLPLVAREKVQSTQAILSRCVAQVAPEESPVDVVRGAEKHIRISTP